MRKFMYFISADSNHLQRRLERLAEKGLELVDTEGFFTGNFQETKRTDLYYLTVPYGAQQYYPRSNDFSLYGWELVGGFNGVAIFKSLPLNTQNTDGLIAKLEQDGCIHKDRVTIPIYILILCVLTLLLQYFGKAYPVFGDEWFMSYLGIVGHSFRAIVFLLFVLNVVTLRSYLSAWIHGLTPFIFVSCLFISLVLAQLDESAQTLYFIGILCILAVAASLSLWRLNRRIGLFMSGLCLVVLCVGLLFPHVDETALGGTGLRRAVEDKPVITLADLNINDELEGTGYRTEGSFLVHRSTYWELSEAEGSIFSDVYRCATTSLADNVSQNLRSVGTWEQMDYGFRQNNGNTVLLRRNKTLAVISFREPLSSEQIEMIYQEIFF